jgi:transcriptional regulator with XRE-family HTH domain
MVKRPRTLGEALGEAKARKGHTQKETALALGVSQPEVNRLLGDDGIPGLLHAAAVAEYLGKTLEEVVDLAGESARRRARRRARE